MVVAPTLGIRGRVVIGAQLVTFCRHSIIGETSVTCVTRSFVTRSFSYRFRLPHTMYFLFYILFRGLVGLSIVARRREWKAKERD